MRHTRYWTMNYSVGSDAKFFEGTTVDNKRVLPLQESKIWARVNGYTHIEVVSLKRGEKDKIIRL